MVTGLGGLGTLGQIKPGPMPIDSNTDASPEGSLGPRPEMFGRGPIRQMGKPVIPPNTGAPMPGPAPAPTPTAGAPADSPLGMWQNWLSTMGPYLAQMPTSQPNAESGGLSSLSPSATGLGLRGYWGPDTGFQGHRGLRMLALQ